MFEIRKTFTEKGYYRDFIDFETPLEDSLVKDARAYFRARDRQLDQAQAAPMLEVGARVSHVVFGEGVIVGIDADRSAYQVQFDGMETHAASRLPRS